MRRRTAVIALTTSSLAAAVLIAAAHPASTVPWAQKCLGKRATLLVSGHSARGTPGADVIVVTYRSGATVDAGRGPDLICGGPGGDRLVGGPGADRLRGGVGNDRLFGGAGPDVLSGQTGTDDLQGGAGIDRFLLAGKDTSDATAGEFVNGRRKVVDAHLRASTVLATSAAVKRIVGDPAGVQRVTLARGVRPPEVGGALVVPASAAYPLGLLGVVTRSVSASNGSTLLTTRPGTASDAYADLRVSLAGTLGEIGSLNALSGGFGFSGVPRLKPTFDCKGSGFGPTVQVELDLSPVGFQLDYTLDPSILFVLNGSPIFQVDFGFKAAVKCTARPFRILIPIPRTPLVLALGPAVTVEVGGNAGARFRWTPKITYGFFRSRSAGNYDLRSFANAGINASLTGEAAAELYLGWNTELTLGGRVGVGGTLGPVVSGRYETQATPPRTCRIEDVAFRAELTASANVLFKNWTFAIARVTFGRWPLRPPSCSGGPGQPPPPGPPPPGPSPPPTPPPSAPWEQRSPAASSDGTDYFIVWADRRRSCGFVLCTDLYGARVTPQGHVADRGGILIARDLEGVGPAVAFDGENYLVVWVGGGDLRAARVARSGTVLDPGGFVIAPGSMWVDGSSPVAIAFDGSNYLVTWSSPRESTGDDIFGVRVTPAGGVLDPDGILISSQAENDVAPSLAFDGTNYLVAWQSGLTIPRDIYGARVTRLGTVLDTAPIPISTSSDYESEPQIGFDGSNYLVVWTHTFTTSGSGIKAARVAPSGVVQDPSSGFWLGLSGGFQHGPSVAFGGSTFLVAWTALMQNTGDDVLGTRVTPSGAVLDYPSPLAVATSPDTTFQSEPTLAWNGLNHLAAWQNGLDGNRDIFGGRITAAGGLLDPGGFVISTAADN